MGNEVALHLSGGVFFNLMLAARKKPVANQNQCLKELLYIYDRSAKEISGPAGSMMMHFYGTGRCFPFVRT